jgi:hypothetical protein
VLKKGVFTEGVFYLIFKILIMNVLELKGELLDMISEFKKEEQLLKLHEVAKKMTDEAAAEDEEEDWWGDLSDAKREHLEKAIAHSRIPANRIPHEEVKKRHAKWLSK